MTIESADQAASAVQHAAENGWLSSAASAVWAWALKFVAGKTFLGLMGAAALFFLMPPGRPNDAPTSRKDLARETAGRVFLAGLASEVGGDWFVAFVNNLFPFLLASSYPKPFLMAAGALGWYAGRPIALWLYKRQDKDAGELVRDFKHDFGGTPADENQEKLQ